MYGETSPGKEKNAMSVTITVNRAELGSALAFASLGLSRYPAAPALAAVRVQVTAAPALELGAFDYETCATATAGGTTPGGTGGTLVYGSELTAAVRSLPAGKGTDQVTVTVGDDSLALLCDGWTATVAALPAEAAAGYPAYPPLPPLTATLTGEAFARSAARTAACASTDDTLPVLTCVSLAFSEETGTLVMAATDRYKLAVDTQPADGTDGTSLVSAVLLAKFAQKCDKAGKVSVGLGGEHVAFSDGTRTLITRAGTGEFIRYRDRMGGEYPTSVTAGAAALSKVIARAGKVTGKNERLGFEVSEAGVKLTAVRDGKVSGTQVVPAAVTGPPAETGFNPGYLASVLSGIAGDVVIGLPADAGRKPARVSSADGFSAIVVPLRRPESPYSKAA